MSRNTRLRLFCYDVQSNRRRRKVAKALEAQATRVQLSVFETRLTDKAAERLAEKVSEFLDDHDSLRVYTIGKTSEPRCQVYGSGIPIEAEATFWIL